MRGNWFRMFEVGCPSCRQPVRKTSTGPHPFFNHQQTPEGRDVSVDITRCTPFYRCHSSCQHVTTVGLLYSTIRLFIQSKPVPSPLEMNPAINNVHNSRTDVNALPICYNGTTRCIPRPKLVPRHITDLFQMTVAHHSKSPRQPIWRPWQRPLAP